jgi:hypothetical protein
MTPPVLNLAVYDERVLVVEEETTPTHHRLLCCLRQREAQDLLPTIAEFAKTGTLRGPGGEEPEKI